MGWIGLVVPHSKADGRERYEKAIPMCMLFGATFMIIADVYLACLRLPKFRYRR
ncbi:MAG: hypothetical protein ACLRSW_06800 [Christensenellaceae bacterium]